MKILLADDNPEVRSALQLLLEQDPIQAEVVQAADMNSLLAHLAEDCPLVTLLDWELPGLQGSDIWMKLHAHCASMKVIALSSKFEARQEALAAGADAFVSKAEPPEKILSALRALIPDLKDLD